MDISQIARRSWQVESYVEVYSRSTKSWCPGVVIAVNHSNSKLTVKYQLMDGTFNEKTIRRSDWSLRMQHPLSREAMTAGSPLNVYSRTERKWCPGIVTSLREELITIKYRIADGTYNEKDVSRWDSCLKLISPIEALAKAGNAPPHPPLPPPRPPPAPNHKLDRLKPPVIAAVETRGRHYNGLPKSPRLEMKDRLPRTPKNVNGRTTESSDSSVDFSEIHFSQLSFGCEIGEGGFASVYKGVWNGRQVAIKKMHMTDESVELLENEIDIMCRLRHDCIVKLFGVCVNSPKCYLVMELCDTSLWDFLHKRKHRSFPINLHTRLSITHQVTSGLNFLHTNGVIHRDLNASNVLINNIHKPECKITDFGLSKRGMQAYTRTLCGTPAYMAPELYGGRKRQYNESTDMFALGILMHQIMTRSIPFDDMRSWQITDAIKTNQRPQKHPWWSNELVSLLSACWHAQPRKRPNVAQTLRVAQCFKDDHELLFKIRVNDAVSVYSISQESWLHDGTVADLCDDICYEYPIGSILVEYDKDDVSGKSAKWIEPHEFRDIIKLRSTSER